MRSRRPLASVEAEMMGKQECCLRVRASCKSNLLDGLVCVGDVPEFRPTVDADLHWPCVAIKTGHVGAGGRAQGVNQLAAPFLGVESRYGGLRKIERDWLGRGGKLEEGKPEMQFGERLT